MAEIKLGDIYAWLVGALAVIGTATGVYTFLKKGINKVFHPLTVKLETLSNDLNKKIDKLQETMDEKLDKVDRNATMNYLVARMADIDNGEKLDGVARKRFIDEYEHYTKELSGNSYIKEEFDRLKAEHKL